MSRFISEAELNQIGGDIPKLVERAEAYIQDLLQQLETNKARADAAAINAEQNCALIEQKFLSLSDRFAQAQHEHSQLSSALERRTSELAQSQTTIHRLELESVKKENELERISFEVGELHKSKRELIEVLEHRNLEINEKNASITTYLDKIVFLTKEHGELEAKLHENEAQIARIHAVQARISQEKELLEQHNAWLNEELTSKVADLLEERKRNADSQAQLCSKLSEAERTGKEAAEKLQRATDEIKDLRLKLKQTREELIFAKEDGAAKEKHLEAEVATATKLAELYKQSSEEWSKKSGELEGVIKALEEHLNQVEMDSRKQLEEAVNSKEALEKETSELREKLQDTIKELEASKLDRESDSFPLTLVKRSQDRLEETLEQELSLVIHDGGALPPDIPSGISATAFAAALLRDGWTITRIYVKYQEAVDAWRHERQGRKHCQSLLERVLHEIEQKAEVIMDERAEHARMLESYSVLESKLHFSLEEQTLLNNSLHELKADLKRKERESKVAQREVSDLHTQIAVLLKECADIKQQGAAEKALPRESAINALVIKESEITASDLLISDRIISFKDIHGMVEHNSQLRILVRSLSEQNEQREWELKETFDIELKKRTDELAAKVAIVVKKSEEQNEIIESLQGTVGMYRRLYEEEVKSRDSFKNQTSLLWHPDHSGDDLRQLVAKSEEEIHKVRDEAVERIKSLEKSLEKARQEARDARLERDRLIIEATYAREQLQAIVRESENQRKEMEAVLARNVEFSQTILDYQRRLRENAQRLEKAEENARRLSIEVSVLEKEKDLISNAEKRASQEVASLSDRVHRLQATLDNIHTTEEVRESIRAAEIKKLESELNRLQREWAEAKREVEMERAHTRHCADERDEAVKHAMNRIDTISNDLADALREVSKEEARAHVAEARCVELEASLKKADDRILAALTSSSKFKMDMSLASDPDIEANALLCEAREEIEHLKENLEAAKVHVAQYKMIAQANESALKEMENAHNCFKAEAERKREFLESELSTLKRQLEQAEAAALEKENKAKTIAAEKDKVLEDAMKELVALRDSESSMKASLEQAEERIKALKDEVEKRHQMWRLAQNNYERQVLLQADTIRELTSTSERLSTLEKEVLRLNSEVEGARSELESSKVAWEMERSSLIAEKSDMDLKLKEINEQNKILLDRLDVMHQTVIEQEHKGSGLHQGSRVAGQGDSDMQNVIQYLRRSKEMADTEITLLKQERLRLQKQLEAALRATTDAHNRLQNEHENVRASICSEEEFMSLQAQIREMNLLRESNAQLREENQHIFEECQALQERTQQAQAEMEALKRGMREKQVELEATEKEVEIEKAEIIRWQDRVSQLLEKFKNVDMDDYQNTKSTLLEIQGVLNERLAELAASRKEVDELTEKLLKIEQETSTKDKQVSDLESKVQELIQSETSCKAEMERCKKQLTFLRRKVDTSNKEKEDILKERDVYSKQVEDLKANAGKRTIHEAAAQNEQSQKEIENLLKEKETRMQSLERTLEREREELRKEKARRQKDQKVYVDVVQKAKQEREKYMEEINSLKKEKDQYLEGLKSVGTSAAFVQGQESKSESKEDKEKEIQSLRAMIQEKERDAKMEARKTGRRLIRPKIEPLNQQEVQTEPGEVLETHLEATDAEIEMQEEGKVFITPISESMDIVNATTAVILGKMTSVTTEGFPTSVTPESGAAAETASVNEQQTLSPLFDQISSSESLEKQKLEAGPLGKRSRLVDLSSPMIDIEIGATDNLAISEPAKENEAQTDDVAATAVDIICAVNRKIDNSDASNVIEAVEVHATEITEVTRDRISGGLENPASKRPRITRPDAIALQQPLIISERKASETQKEKREIFESEQQVKSKTEINVEEENSIQECNKVEEMMEIEKYVSECVPAQSSFNDVYISMNEQLPSHIDTDLAVGETTAELVSEGTDQPGTLVIPSNENGAGIPSTVNTSQDSMPEGENQCSITDDKLHSIGDSATVVDVVISETHTDVEEGEIEADFATEQITELETIPSSATLEEAIEQLNEEEAAPANDALSQEDTQLSVEADVPEKLEVSSSTAEPSSSMHATQMEGHKVTAEVASKENAPLQPTARQGVRSATTIVLAERARERALIRRSGISPPSPSARGRGRGTKGTSKRSIGLQQAVPVSSEGLSSDGKSEEEKASQLAARVSTGRRAASHSASTANKSDTRKEEQE